MARESVHRKFPLMRQEFYSSDKKGKCIICPLCGGGSGPKETEISENPGKHGNLHCWDCGFSSDAFD